MADVMTSGLAEQQFLLRWLDDFEFKLQRLSNQPHLLAKCPYLYVSLLLFPSNRLDFV